MGAWHLKYFKRLLHEARRSRILHWAVSAHPTGVSWCKGLHEVLKDSAARRYWLLLGLYYKRLRYTFLSIEHLLKFSEMLFPPGFAASLLPFAFGNGLFHLGRALPPIFIIPQDLYEILGRVLGARAILYGRQNVL